MHELSERATGRLPVASPAARMPLPWWARLLRTLTDPWIAPAVEDNEGRRWIAQAEPVELWYVLDRPALSKLLVLDRACRDQGFPSPMQSVRATEPKRRVVAASHRLPMRLESLLENLASDPSLCVQLVPVSVFIGRSPQKASGWLSALFSENWAVVGKLRRALALAFNGQNSHVRFSPAIDLRTVLNEGLSAAHSARKVARVLRTHFRRVRESVIGPDLSTRRMLVGRVLSAPKVKVAIDDQARRESCSVEKARTQARRYAMEIAADYSPPLVRAATLLLRPVLTRIYGGIDVHHIEHFKRDALGHEVVYVPSHRSHMDDLLLPYLLHAHGVVPPHIVAGANLNMPIVGTLMRKCGAFFIRRSIRGNVLYSAVFSEYTAQLVSGGYSMAYFIEGGRSRTGRLLTPQGGTLVMTIRAYLNQPSRPVMFQPVYIGYERMVEGKSYLDELSGKPKVTETIGRLLSGVKTVLRSNFGRVTLNFGEPIYLADLLATHAPSDNAEQPAANGKPRWVSDVVNELGNAINQQVNAAAHVNPINLLALTVLATQKHAMVEAELISQLQFFRRALDILPYSSRVTVTPMSPAEIIAYGESAGLIQRVVNPLGDVIRVATEEVALLSYFRNNVAHLFLESAWLACCFQHDRRIDQEAIIQSGDILYPFLRAELFVTWTPHQFGERLLSAIEFFVSEGLLECEVFESDAVAYRRCKDNKGGINRLRVVGQPLQQAFQRYYIVVSILRREGSGSMTAGELELACHVAARRLSMLYAPSAPEFFDRALFRGFVQQLRAQCWVSVDDDGNLVFDERLDEVASEAASMLSREQRATLMQATGLRS